MKPGREKRDRISSLPDCLIHLIMSFLTAQEAVQTCVLSKRWKNLWTTLPFLDFDLEEYEYDGVPERRFDMFVNFVNTTLLLREATDLHKFHLGKLYDDFQQYHMSVRSWIQYALKHNIQEFSIEFPLQDSSVPLDGVFNCASLIDLSINDLSRNVFETHQVTVVNLPCLKQLYLRGIELLQDFVDDIFSGCPVLEFLHLEDCGLGFSTMNSQRLKYLNIGGHELHYEPEEQMELIEAPNLLSFCYDQWSYQMGDKLHLKMPSLTSAFIIYDDKLQGILTGLSNVQNLELGGYGIKDVLENELPNCPEFSNLKDFSMESFNHFCLLHRFNLLASFLNHCPRLENLSLVYRGCFCRSEEQVPGNEELLKIAPFKGKQLKIVKVGFSKSEQSFPQLVKYLQDFTCNSSARINMIS
ncbi:FBD-associated F-box protein [Rhynchospora pubera]|uniref:FBD-associated F-box protein n=1 Tax=Rhynchospora pubera TaxID=906938 RepID=A0AAV8DQY3_9POAL|nr:FBD-associated F-box protein [Rhynchospora pubera]